MNVYTKTKVLFKFGSLERLYVETRSKKRFKLPLNLYTWSTDKQVYMYMLSQMWKVLYKFAVRM